MAGRSSKQNNRGASLFSLLTSGKNRDHNTYKGGPAKLADKGIVASGGVINDYTEGGKIYRAHVFTASSTFVVSETAVNLSNDVDYLVVGGGGGAGAYHSTNGSGGAGAGGLRTNMPTCPYKQAGYTIGTGNYTVVCGGGGSFARENPSQPAPAQLTTSGSNSEFYPTPGGSGLTGNGDTEAVPLVSKAGANSMHRFLTTIQEMDLPMELKTAITEICVNKTDNTGISEFVGGQVITSSIDNPLQSDSFLYTQGEALDILASEYVAPPVLTQVKSEQFVAPPTQTPAQNINFTGGNTRPF